MNLELDDRLLFPEDMAADPPSPLLNVLPSSIRFAGKLKEYHIMRPGYL